MDASSLLQTITKGDIALIGIALLSVVQITPIKINPWTWIAKHIGRAINGEVIKEVRCLKSKISDMEKREALKNAESCRNRILRFDDELRLGIKHSKEYFDVILADIDWYLDFCRKNKQYPNSKADSAIRNVLEVYDKVKKSNDFI